MMEGTASQIAIGLVVSMGFQAIQMQLEPYMQSDDDKYAGWAHQANSLVLIASLLMYTRVTEDDGYNEVQFSLALILVTLALVVAAICFVVKDTLEFGSCIKQTLFGKEATPSGVSDIRLSEATDSGRENGRASLNADRSALSSPFGGVDVTMDNQTDLEIELCKQSSPTQGQPLLHRADNTKDPSGRQRILRRANFQRGVSDPILLPNSCGSFRAVSDITDASQTAGADFARPSLAGGDDDRDHGGNATANGNCVNSFSHGGDKISQGARLSASVPPPPIDTQHPRVDPLTLTEGAGAAGRIRDRHSGAHFGITRDGSRKREGAPPAMAAPAIAPPAMARDEFLQARTQNPQNTPLIPTLPAALSDRGILPASRPVSISPPPAVPVITTLPSTLPSPPPEPPLRLLPPPLTSTLPSTLPSPPPLQLLPPPLPAQDDVPSRPVSISPPQEMPVTITLPSTRRRPPLAPQLRLSPPPLPPRHHASSDP